MASCLVPWKGSAWRFWRATAAGTASCPAKSITANIYAMKLLGVERIISVSAVGSLKEDLRPGEFLVPDQFFDRTKNRKSTFFGEGIVVHVAFAHPTCGQLSGVLADAW